MKPNPIIVALDFEDDVHARALVSSLAEAVDFYKVGLELYAAAGMKFVRGLLDRDMRVFLDLKMYDIGETVRRAVKLIAKTGVDFLTVHGNTEILSAAVEGRGGSELKLLAVTVLTSFDEQDLRDLGYPCTISELVALRVKNAVAAGVDGIVCSAHEAAAVREIAGPQTVIVTPGVRSRTMAPGDQKRVATPAEALAAGANYIVIGREVTRAADPAAEIARIRSEIAQAAHSSAAG